MLGTMSSAQWQEWLEFMELEPFGPRQEEVRMGVIASLITNGNPYRGKSAKALYAHDFFPSLKTDRPAFYVQPIEQMKAAAMQWAALSQEQLLR